MKTGFRRLNRQLKRERGQASLMIGMMLMTFILFFAFVVNTGMLVNAKINLQNAADLAAYAGAATQARQLTQISYLNYEMRRQYKKFLFRYYVVGNMAQKSFTTQPNLWSPDGNPANSYGVPSVCLIFKSSDNFCQLKTLPAINIPTPNPLDQINQTLITQLKQIESLRELNCGYIGAANTSVLLLWLYNVDPKLTNLGNSLSGLTGQDLINAQAIVAVMQGVAQGLGLVPREIILNLRANTLAGYVNSPANLGVSLDQVNSLKQGPDPASKERTIQAFLSAYNTLGNNTFDPTLISMDELIPSAGDQAQLINLLPIREAFDTYSVAYAQGLNGSCDTVLVPTTVPQPGVPVGVAKDPKVLTYYAVRLKARAKVMFSPFGDMDLKAYAAARPFGSRIGPAPDAPQAQFTYKAAPNNLAPGVNAAGTGTSTIGYIPNLGIAVQETPAEGTGWDNNSVLTALYGQMLSSGGQANSPDVNAGEFDNGYYNGMVPNPIEGNVYNIMNDQGPDSFVKSFDSNHFASFWAPVVPPGQAANVGDAIKSAAQEIFSTPNGGNSSVFGNQNVQNAIMAGITNDLITYAGLMSQNPPQGTEDGESLNVVRIGNPFENRQGTPINLPATIMMTNPTQFKTSWNTENDNAKLGAEGRVGYSVKFVSFSSLVNPTTTTNGATVWTNKNFMSDDEAEQDLTVIQH
jgi:hypothetical protein